VTSASSRVALILIVSLSTACSSAMAPVTTPSPTSDAASRQAAMERARADSMRLPYTATDIHFMSAMIHHHAQAIEMSQLAPTRASNNGVKILASRIINAQQDEIAIMQRWLEDRNQPVPEAKGGPMKMIMNGVEHEMLMEGMLTAEQMAELSRASGQRFDELFLRYMIQHHRGAVTMVKELFATDGAGQDETTFRLATDVNVDQITEINRMERLLFEVMVERSSPE
jgi:uncharacterized protein (DUF305 family)